VESAVLYAVHLPTTQSDEHPPMVVSAPSQVTRLTPLLFVRDIRCSLAFYVGGLGFAVASEWTSPEGDDHWRLLKRGEVGLMLHQTPVTGPDARIPADDPGEGIDFCVMCSDAIAVYHEALTRGIELEPPSVANGHWITGAIDPDGFAINFQSPTDQPEDTVYQMPAVSPLSNSPTAAQPASLVPLLDVADIRRSLAYYVDGLGFTVINHWTSPAGNSQWNHLRLGDAEVMLQQFPFAHAQPGQRGHDVYLVIACDNATSIYRAVRLQGIAMSPPAISNGEWMIEGTDPDGYALSFHSSAAGNAESL